MSKVKVTILKLDDRLARVLSVPRLLTVRRFALLFWLRCARLERLLKIRNDVVDVLRSNRNPNEILPYPLATMKHVPTTVQRLSLIHISEPTRPY